uniref:Pre-mRNA-processing factor 19 n=1 Tax=Moniliophthora roreri TaxID=221103 RepID=A0A0W0F5S8_MONRR
MFFCAISGLPPQEPVVSTKSGKVYEKRLIVKHIEANGTDPVSGDKLEEADLIAIKACKLPPSQNFHPSRTSIPTLLHTLQNEWDALVLETFALKQQYNNTRQELSYALYAQDAASRVVARLIRERDAAREALANVQASMGVAPSASAEDVEMTEEGASEEGLPKEIVAQIDETHQTLSAARKKRKPPAGYATADEVKTFTSKHTIPSLHSASPSGITALALSSTNTNHFLTGGNDKVVQLYDKSTDKVLASLKGHTKKVNHVAFREKEGDPRMLLSAGADKIAKVWSHDEASGEYIPKATLRQKGELTGLAVHPTSAIFAVSSTDKTYSLYDFTNFNAVFKSVPSEDPFTALSIHPDGTLLALGTPNSTIQIYDVRTGGIAASLTPADTTPFTINTLSFSENGYHLLAPGSSSTVAVWDLRKQKVTQSLDMGDNFKINRVLYDVSAQFLAVAGSTGARVFMNKSWEELVRFEEGGEMSDIAFGESGKEIWGTTGREVRIWGLPA